MNIIIFDFVLSFCFFYYFNVFCDPFQKIKSQAKVPFSSDTIVVLVTFPNAGKIRLMLEKELFLVLLSSFSVSANVTLYRLLFVNIAYKSVES